VLAADSKSTVIDRPWVILVVLLHVGFLGIPLYWKANYSRNVRLAICVASVVYTVVAVAIIVWGVVQIAQLFRI